ncbi:hypothetical protein NBRC116494_10500 [Aurantivibrio plasticivorans]
MALLSVPPSDRFGLFKSLGDYVLASNKAGVCVGLLLVDIKNFTSVNRVFDFKYGDLVLYFMSQRLAECVDHANCFYRVGSDEFAIIVPALSNPSEIVIEANSVLDKLRMPFFWQDKEINVDVNMGCIALPADRTSPEELLSSCEHLLQRAKLENRTLCYATESQHGDDDDIWQLEQELLGALHNNELTMVFQPKIDLNTGKPTHAEALLRWTHPTRGAIAPSFLVDMIARLSREFELTKWVLHTALRQVNQWPTDWGANGVAVNIPANIVHHPDFRQLVEDAIRLWRIEPSQLTLEITESAIFEDQQGGYNNLSYLKGRGIEISIDDFGTGYSSLQYFKTIPATELKIDQSFVLNMANSQGDRNIAQLIIDLAHRFGLRVVAEGVETIDVLDELRRLGCDYAQGFFISRPVSSNDYATWLSEYRQASVIS